MKLRCTEKTREHSKEMKKKEETIGCHLPIGVIIKREGGWKDPAAVKAGCTRVLKCIALGGTFIKWDNMTDR